MEAKSICSQKKKLWTLIVHRPNKLHSNESEKLTCDGEKGQIGPITTTTTFPKNFQPLHVVPRVSSSPKIVECTSREFYLNFYFSAASRKKENIDRSTIKINSTAGGSEKQFRHKSETEHHQNGDGKGK